MGNLPIFADLDPIDGKTFRHSSLTVHCEGSLPMVFLIKEAVMRPPTVTSHRWGDDDGRLMANQDARSFYSPADLFIFSLFRSGSFNRQPVINTARDGGRIGCDLDQYYSP